MRHNEVYFPRFTLSYKQRDAERRSLTSFLLSSYTFSFMENRTEVVNVLTSRVIENAPLRELIRVYSEAVQAAIGNLSDDDVIRSIDQAGYKDILETFNLEVPPAAETEG